MSQWSSDVWNAAKLAFCLTKGIQSYCTGQEKCCHEIYQIVINWNRSKIVMIPFVDDDYNPGRFLKYIVVQNQKNDY